MPSVVTRGRCEVQSCALHDSRRTWATMLTEVAKFCIACKSTVSGTTYGQIPALFLSISGRRPRRVKLLLAEPLCLPMLSLAGTPKQVPLSRRLIHEPDETRTARVALILTQAPTNRATCRPQSVGCRALLVAARAVGCSARTRRCCDRRSDHRRGDPRADTSTRVRAQLDPQDQQPSTGSPVRARRCGGSLRGFS